ncbi:MAG: GIY-YIG nuclease family protein [Clostridiaceae bacterium]|nr:GIY-YIG nuclease family protein [Clostridiaceae bacterium]
MHYVYILECSDSSLYAGYTIDLDKRLKVHNQGKGSKYTRVRLPVKLVYNEKFENKSDALKREYQIKQLTRKKKEELIQGLNCENSNINLQSKGI